MPPGAINVARPTRWGNPVEVGAMVDATLSLEAHGRVGLYGPRYGHRIEFSSTTVRPLTAEEAVRMYAEDLDDAIDSVPDDQEIVDALYELAGYDLACYCALDAPCHADILLDRANR